MFPSPGDATKAIGREGLEKNYRVTVCLADIHCSAWLAQFAYQPGWRSWLRMAVVKTPTDHTHDTEVTLAYDRGRYETQLSAVDLALIKRYLGNSCKTTARLPGAAMGEQIDIMRPNAALASVVDAAIQLAQSVMSALASA